MSRETQHVRTQQTLNAVVEALADLTDEKGYPPTKAEIATKIGKSTTTVRKAIQKLIEAGVVTEGAGPRTLHLC